MLSEKDIESFTDADILSNVFTGIKINSELVSEYLVAALPQIAVSVFKSILLSLSY